MNPRSDPTRPRRRAPRAAPAIVAVLGLLAAGTAPVRAQDRVSLVLRGKRATALVVVPAATGTAFCVGADGYFVTNAHVTEGAGGEVTLLIHPGEAGQRRVGARVLREDKDADLALLKADGVAGLTALALGEDGALMETDSVTAFGYPFGTDLALSENSYPAVSVSVGHITALRRDKAGLQYIQLDASLNPGNSGGPVLDSAGRVIGVVEAGVPGAALNFAIPVHVLSAFLRRPTIVLWPRSVARAAAHRAQDFTIDVNPLFPAAAAYSVGLSLSTPYRTQRRTFAARRLGPSRYRVSAVPVPPVPPGGRVWVSAMGHPTPGAAPASLFAEVPDCALLVRGRMVPLSGLGSVTFVDGRPGTILLADGEAVPGPVTGLTGLPAYVDGAWTRVDFTRFAVVSIVDPSRVPASVSYSVTVRGPAGVVGTLAGTLALPDAPPAALARGPAAALARGPGEGLLVVCADAGPTSDVGYTRGPAGSSEHFVANVVRAFAARPGRFLRYLGPPGPWRPPAGTVDAFGDLFWRTAAAGGRALVGLSSPGVLGVYGAVFVQSDDAVDWAALAQYLAHGGQVYIAVCGGAPGAALNNFLTPYGLEVTPGARLAAPEVVGGFSGSALLSGVGGLLFVAPGILEERRGLWPGTQLVSSGGGVGSVAVVRVPAAAR